MPKTYTPCPLCQRELPLTAHHLIPRKMHRRTHFKKHFSKDELQQTIMVCRQCHSAIHKQYDEMALAKRFYTLELIKADEDLARQFAWIARQKRVI